MCNIIIIVIGILLAGSSHPVAQQRSTNRRAVTQQAGLSQSEYAQSTEWTSPEEEALAAEQAREDEANRLFNGIMSQRYQRSRSPAPRKSVAQQSDNAEVTLTLNRFAALRDSLHELREYRNRQTGPAVILGASEYNGTIVEGSLALTLTLSVTLGRKDTWKMVPIAGDDVILVSAKVNGKEIPVSCRDKYHIWLTGKTGEVTITADIIVPSRGPRGSIEYGFKCVRTPRTLFTCRFPHENLEPRLSAALTSSFEKIPRGTRYNATLRPTTRIHLIGFRDMGSDKQQAAKVYAETMNLLSIDNDALELFAVFHYTILYSGTQQFTIHIPEGLKVLSADGRGAFRYELREEGNGGAVLVGETAFPIRNNYEISLRLRRELDNSGETFAVPVPRCREVERELGWLGVEIPGKLKLEEKKCTDMLAIDMRQLPDEILRSAVSPILKAYRYHLPTAGVHLHTARLPEIEPTTGSIDHISATTNLTTEGAVITDLRITLRNRLRHNLRVALHVKEEVLSATLDRQPLNLSRDDEGYLLIPLKRSEGGEQLRAFTLSLIIKTDKKKLRFFGLSSLQLPEFDLPVSSLKWNVYVPGFNTYSRLYGPMKPQYYNGEASWQRPPFQYRYENESNWNLDVQNEVAGGITGAMPVRIKIPKNGKQLIYNQYWLEAKHSPKISFAFVHSSLLIPLRLLLTLLLSVGLFLTFFRFTIKDTGKEMRSGIVLLLIAIPALLLTGAIVHFFTGILLGGATLVWYYRKSFSIKEWAAALRTNYAEKRAEKKEKRKIPQLLFRFLCIAVFLVVGCILATQLLMLINLFINHPLAG